MHKLIYNFKNSEIPQPSEVGGKAKALIETTRAGFPVPEGIILTVDFFKPWLKDIKSSNEWKALLSEVTKEKCYTLKAKAAKQHFTDLQKLEFNKHLSDLKRSKLYAVRSSSPEEDLESTSFAGMYETLLGVTVENLEIAIAKAFASMLDFRVMEYKKQKAINIENTCISVIIQKQIASDVSGVGFSLNPQNNCYDEAVINASFGLGETIVKGLVIPDRYVVEKVKKMIVEKTVNVKSQGLWLRIGGGSEKQDNEEPKAQALNDNQIFEVVDLISKCEAYYGFPIDGEWTYEGDKLYLLQARPITTYIPLFPELLTKPGERKKLYVDLIGCSQGFSEQLSVLGLDIWAMVMDTIGGQGIMPAGEGGFLVNLHGKQYFDVSNILKGMGHKLAIATVGNQDHVIRDRKDELIPEYEAFKTTKAMRESKKAMVKVAFATIPTMIKMFLNPQKQKVIYTELVNQVIEKIKKLENNKPFEQLVYDGFKILDLIVKKAVAYVPGQLALSRIKKMFKNAGLDDEITAMGMNLSSNPTAAMGKSLFQLACDPEIKATATAEEFEQKIKSRSYSKEFMKKYDEHMYLYGDRGFKEIDIGTPRVRENQGGLYNQLVHINIEDSQMTKAVERKKAAYKRLHEEAVKLGKTKKFEKNADIYENLFGFRETPKYLVVMLIGRLHTIAWEIGYQLVREGRIERAEQIFALHLNEITMAQRDKNMKLLPLIEANMAPYKKVKHIKQWPINIDSRGKIYKPIPKGTASDLVGEAISSGVIKGKAKVLESPYEKPLEPGDILVTHASEPAWTPIFINASGVVLEVGGLLQHGAIIAREYGIPCVSGLREATHVIKDGDLLEVDGTSGIVRIIKE